MNWYLTVDGGTTNTRVALVHDRQCKDVIKLGVGARKGIEKRELLKGEIKTAIAMLLERNRLTERDITCVLASGMITSEFGLCRLEHISAPAGIAELHDGIERMRLKDVTEIPFAFIRGVKIASDNFEKFDVMRGEETELMGILSADYGECIYILPGSHSKIIRVDENGRIVDFATMLTGEMIGALSQQTILKDAVDLSLSQIDKQYLLKGYDCAAQSGINKALFKTRILKSFFGCNKDEAYSFFIGAVLSAEIKEILKDNADTVVLGGRLQIKNAMAEILKERGNKRIILLDEDTVNASTPLGAVRIFEYRA